MFKTERYHAFEKFYKENKNRIHMPRSENYPMNYKLAHNWAQSQCDTDSRDFAKAIISHTLYISYETFARNISHMCESYNKKHENVYKDHVFVMIIPFSACKSNTWVSMLIFDKLKHMINDIDTNITDVYNKTLNKNTPFYQKTVHCIIADDASYTGNQLLHSATFDFKRMYIQNRPEQPAETDRTWLIWYDRMSDLVEKYIKTIDINEFSVDLLIPYMGAIAKEKMKHLHYVRVLNSSFIFLPFSQQINIDKIPPHILNEFKKTFQYHRNISAIYFDHKIADAISTFHKIYILAPLFNCAVDNKSFSFIENCSLKEIPSNIDIYEYHIDLERSGAKVCPKTFYKSIKYTFNGKKINTELNVLSSICKQPKKLNIKFRKIVN